MLRVVIDTNVYVAALLSRAGAPATILRALADGAFDALICPHLLMELGDVLAPEKIARHVPAPDALAFIEWLERIAVNVADPNDVTPISPDPGDDFLIALAQGGRASFVISGDAHLLGLDIRDPATASPATFAALLEALDR